jgi:hypothetical protein
MDTTTGCISDCGCVEIRVSGPDQSGSMVARLRRPSIIRSTHTRIANDTMVWTITIVVGVRCGSRGRSRRLQTAACV